MRTAALLALALALAVTASAAPSSKVTLGGPVGPVTVDSATPTVVTVTVGLELMDFGCAADTAFQVAIEARAPAGVEVSVDKLNATFLVPGGTYFDAAYHGNDTVNVTLQGNATEGAQATVVATFSPPPDACVAAGGFPPGGASWSLALRPGAPPAPEPPTPTPDPGEVPPAPDANATGETNGSEPDAAPNGTLDPDAPQAPGTLIGDYTPPQESKGVPGPGIALVLAALVSAGVLARRPRR
ncbi:MAG TPA: hypothetical protein VHH36_05980 [Candidatus Thermoplasmatota archaeon]|nr:hypothetical protein [Candidatus Thermoplasmatota archaeon]